MSTLLPVAVYGLEVPPGDIMIPSVPDFPATFRITMAAIDPSAPPMHAGTTNQDAPARATLKVIRRVPEPDEDDSDESSDDEDALKALLNGAASDDSDEDSSSEEANGGPSDPLRTKKVLEDAAVENLKKALAESTSDDDMKVDGVNGTNGAVATSTKGKARAIGEDEESEDEEEGEDLDLDEFVLCTLNPDMHHQQTLDLTVGVDEEVFFKVSGTHTVYLTGNYVIPPNDSYGNEPEDYDLSPDEDELELDMGEEDSDDLDQLEDPRISEIASDEEEDQPAPKLVKNNKEPKKGKNKRAVEDSDEEATNLDDIMAKSLKPAEAAASSEPKLSRKQLKKLKNNAGEAAAAAAENKNVKKVEPTKDSPNPKGDKKVQFAKNLEQGPSTGNTDSKDVKSDTKTEERTAGDNLKTSLGKKTVQGVTIDDRKLGKGPAAKNGDKIGMRYIGKLKDGKVFDANKKGPPFTFTLGRGEVIKGWDIGVAGLSVGGERRIEIPANLAYGNKSMPGIPAKSPLIFDVKLLSLK